MTIRRLAALCLALFWFALTSTALGVDATPQERERARGLLDRGDQLTAAGDARGALVAYTAADDIMGVPTTGIEVGRAQRSLGLLLEARDTWIQVTRYPAAPGEPPPFTKARQEAARLASEVGNLIPTISIRVDGARAGTYVIYLDAAELQGAAAGVPLRVNPGKHVILLKTEGHEPASTEITVKEGESPEVTLRPGALVFQQARADSGGASRSSGAGMSLPKALGFIGLGLGGVGISVGSAFGGISMAQASKAKRQCEGDACPTSAEEEIRTAKWTGTVSTVAFIVGGIGAAGGLYFLLTSGSESRRASAAKRRDVATHLTTVIVQPRQQGAQISVEGVF